MHIPVLLKETIEGLNIKSGGVYVDATVNRAGHSKEIAKKLGSDGVLICIDLDQKALDEAKINLEKINNHPKLHFIHSNFRYLTNILKDLNNELVDETVSGQVTLDGNNATLQSSLNLPLMINNQVLALINISSSAKFSTIVLSALIIFFPYINSSLFISAPKILV